MSNFWPYVIAGLASGSVYGLAGTGLVLTYKTSGIFNFAHGTIAALMAYIFYDLWVRAGVPWPLAVAICVLVISPALGWLLERLARRLANAPVVMKVVATVGLLVGVMQLIIIRYGGGTIYIKPFLPTSTFHVAGIYLGYDQLIVMLISLAGMVSLTLVFTVTRMGRTMRAVVDQPDLLALTGTSPAGVRRRAWYIGTAFAGLSGVLLAPTVGLDPIVLSLLVVQAFGAAAIGRFTSVPLTYAGGLGIGVLAALATKYVASFPALAGIPASMPFIVLFGVLALAPRWWLVDFAEYKAKAVESWRPPPGAIWVAGTIAMGFFIVLPYLIGGHLPAYTTGLAYVIIFLSLALLTRTSGQVSLAQLAFAAVGAVASGRLATQAGVPWLFAVLLGGVMAVPVGALLAIPAIRRSGLYLALATFGFAVLLDQLVYPRGFMFGGSGNVVTPRPGFATGDKAYFYVVLGFVVAAIALVAAVQRSRLGRLLHAMSDSPTALSTYGTSVTAIKVIVFCISAFLAGIGGALIGPVSGSSSSVTFASFSSLTLLVVSVLIGLSGVVASVGGAALLIVIPSYITDPKVNNYTPLVFGVLAVAVAIRGRGAGGSLSQWLGKKAGTARRQPGRSPILVRAAAARPSELA